MPLLVGAIAVARPITKDEITSHPLLPRLQDRESGLGQRYFVWAAILGALWRKRDQSLLQVNFRQLQCPDLFASLPGKDQQLHDGAVVRIGQGVPDERKLAISEHTVARLLAVEMLVGPDHRVRVAEALANYPREER